MPGLKKSQLPTSIRIIGVTHRIEYTKDEIAVNGGGSVVVGQYHSHPQAKIIVSTGEHDIEAIHECIIHELLHGVMDAIGMSAFDENHDAFAGLSRALYATLADAGWLTIRAAK